MVTNSITPPRFVKREDRLVALYWTPLFLHESSPENPCERRNPQARRNVAENRKQFALKAIRRLLADYKSGRLQDNAELAEAIAACIRESGEQQLRNLEWLLAQQEQERPDLEDEVRKRPV